MSTSLSSCSDHKNRCINLSEFPNTEPRFELIPKSLPVGTEKLQPFFRFGEYRQYLHLPLAPNTTGSFFGLQGPPQVERCKPEKAAFRVAFLSWCCEFAGVSLDVHARAFS